MSLFNFQLESAVNWVLLAAGNRRVDKMGRSFQPDEQVVTFPQLLTVCAAILVLIVIAWTTSKWIRWRQEKGYHNPRQLFRELCRAHGLTSPQKQMLNDIAIWHGLPNTSQLFVQEELFQSVAMISELGESEGIDTLRSILFGDDADEDPTAE